MGKSVHLAADLRNPCKLKHAGWPTQQDSHRWGVILAGGDGKRLLPLTRRITGDDRPKQFCALTGGDTLLRQTRQRVGRAIPPSQTLLVMTRTHERYYADEATGVPSSCLLIQPYNHGTAPAITYSLTRILQMDPDRFVAFFPLTIISLMMKHSSRTSISLLFRRNRIQSV